MRIVPHSYPWCNLEGVKTATVEKEKGSAKQRLQKPKILATYFLVFKSRREEEFTIYGAFSALCSYKWCCCNAVQKRLYCFSRRKAKQTPLNKAGRSNSAVRIKGFLIFVKTSLVSFLCNPEVNIFCFDPHHVFYSFTLMKRLPWFPSASSCLSVLSLLSGVIFGGTKVLNLSYEHRTFLVRGHFVETDGVAHPALSIWVSMGNYSSTSIYIKALCDTLTLPSNTWSVCNDHFQIQAEADWNLTKWHLSGHQAYRAIT